MDFNIPLPQGAKILPKLNYKPMFTKDPECFFTLKFYAQGFLVSKLYEGGLTIEC